MIQINNSFAMVSYTFETLSSNAMYPVNHKKRDILFLTITSANLIDFYSFYIILIMKKFYKRQY